MRIYRMTATFGKLEHETLELQPGLNIITAPNEWGKSTWCAFLVAMLYGLDTRAKTTKTTLADKERYAPWSGAPMAGRIDLSWNGRDITIERRTKRRIPLGEFRAYETESGLPVTELTAQNCGQMLLGVEQTVFRRAGFIRHADLPVTQDEALRRRLNALVTTGDDSGAADRLAASLKDLKNRCRYNRSGLLPQAEARREELESKINELDALDIQTKKVRVRLEEIKDWLKQLYNHQQALAYSKMEADIERVAKAREAVEQLEQELAVREEACAGLPPKDEVDIKARELRSYREQWTAIQMEQSMAPQQPVEPLLPQPFTGLTAEAAQEMARSDSREYAAMTAAKTHIWLILIGVLGILAAGGLIYMQAYLYAAVAGVVGLIGLAWGVFEILSVRKKTRNLLEKYGDGNFKHWADPIGEYEQKMILYREKLQEYQEVSSDLEVRLMVLRKKRDSLCGIKDPEELYEYWQTALTKWEVCYATRRDAQQARSHYEALNAMVRPVEKPSLPDHLTHSEEETARLLSECALEQQRLQNRLGQHQGRMELLGDKQTLVDQLKQTNARIAKLEDTYGALTIAIETLAQARAELQRRFAPRITKKAQKMLSDMTGGRYTALTMSDDFSLQARAGEEETLHDALWRSDGTMDQLYLALRLAVAEELTPNAPLILDDALVRFDDARMTAAVKILKELAKEKQILCFTCQGREAEV